jgi:hypothetical protein
VAIYRHPPPRFIGGSQPYAPRLPSLAVNAAIGTDWSSDFNPDFSGAQSVTEDKWHQPLSEPRRSFGITAALATAALVWSTFTPTAQTTTIGWLAPLSTPVFQARVTRGTDLVEPVSTAAETVSIDRWLEGLSTPVWPNPGLGAANQAAYFAPPATIDHTSVDRWYQNLANPVWPPRGLRAEFQQMAAMPLSELPETVTEDRWHQPFSLPVWPKPGLTAAQQQSYTAPASEAKETVTVDRWLIGLSTPLYAKSSVQAASQQAYTAPVSEAPESVSVDRWLEGLSNPVWSRPALLAAQQSAFWWSEFTLAPPAVVTVSGWGQPLAQPYPAVRGLHASQQQAVWWSGLTPPPPLASTISAWGQDLSRPYPAARGLHVSQQQAFAPEPISETAEAVSIDRWLIGLSLPVWARPALLTASQTAFFAPTRAIDHTSVDRWHASLSLPVWPKPGLNATEQQVYVAPVSEAPETTTVDRWHAAFSLPVWPKRGLYATQQQYQTAPLSEAPETTTVDRWHQQFSIPVRSRSSPVYQLQTQIIFTAPIIAPVSIGWFQPLSIPTILVEIGLHESFRPPTFFIPFIPFIPSPDREIIGHGGVRLIYGKSQNRAIVSVGTNRLAIKGKA